MIDLATGQKMTHEVYGEIELAGFISVGSELHLNVIQDETETTLDPVQQVNATKVEFLTKSGTKHMESLDNFYKHTDLAE